MRVKRTEDDVALVMSGAEAKVLLEELLDVPGGTHLPKIRQACRELGSWRRLEEEQATERRIAVLYGPKKKKRSSSTSDGCAVTPHNPKLTPDVLERARAMLATGAHVREVAAALGVPRSTLHRVFGPQGGVTDDP